MTDQPRKDDKQSPKLDHSQDKAKDQAHPSGDSPKPHGDPLRDTISGERKN